MITLPADWANYGTIMKDFTAKYGIKITDANPDGSSQDELNAIQQTKGQSRAPDVVDVGTAFAVKGQTAGDWAPYQVATWSDIPAASKEASGQYYADYGGYVAIGYDSSRVKTPPTSFKSLLTGPYKNMVALNGNPTQAGAAFAGVYAAALANGGSFANIAPGVAYFKQLKQAGNFVPVTGSASTMESGQTPILIWWDYLLASEVGAKYKNLKIVIPSDAHYAAYYDQAISKSAPHPAAARLWEEYLFSAEGQNLFLEGGTRPIELPALVDRGHARTRRRTPRCRRRRPGASPSRATPSRTRRRPSSPSSGRASRADQCLNRQCPIPRARSRPRGPSRAPGLAAFRPGARDAPPRRPARPSGRPPGTPASCRSPPTWCSASSSR